MVKIKRDVNTMLTTVHSCHLSIFIFQHYPWAQCYICSILTWV